MKTLLTILLLIPSLSGGKINFLIASCEEFE